jgi:hypothetical protein
MLASSFAMYRRAGQRNSGVLQARSRTDFWPVRNMISDETLPAHAPAPEILDMATKGIDGI